MMAILSWPQCVKCYSISLKVSAVLNSIFPGHQFFPYASEVNLNNPENVPRSPAVLIPISQSYVFSPPPLPPPPHPPITQVIINSLHPQIIKSFWTLYIPRSLALPHTSQVIPNILTSQGHQLSPQAHKVILIILTSPGHRLFPPGPQVILNLPTSPGYQLFPSGPQVILNILASPGYELFPPGPQVIPNILTSPGYQLFPHAPQVILNSAMADHSLRSLRRCRCHLKKDIISCKLCSMRCRCSASSMFILSRSSLRMSHMNSIWSQPCSKNSGMYWGRPRFSSHSLMEDGFFKHS